MPITAYHAKYFAHELTKRSASDSVQKLASTLLDAQVDLNPHQVEAALFAFRSPLSKGAILADEVGLGKTIEAGLVISQKWAEHKRKILIITPANLRKQWSQELKDKFFLSSIILETKSFNYVIKSGNLNPFNQTEIIICSYNFASAKAAYLKNVSWDLCVIDEAHRLRNVYKTGNKTARNIKDALQEAPKILLTATPLQNNLVELYGLVSIIDDYTFGDLKSFKAQYSKIGNTSEDETPKKSSIGGESVQPERVKKNSDLTTFLELKARLKPICKRTLRRHVLEYVPYTNRIALVEEFFPTTDEKKLYDLVSEYLQTDNLYALPSSQRALMTLILRKLLASSTFAISGTLGRLAQKLETVTATQSEIGADDNVAEDFDLYDELKEDYSDDDNAGLKSEKVYSPQDIAKIKIEIQSLRTFEALAKSIVKNSKGEKLFTALEKGFDKMAQLQAPRKAIIFTESTRTQAYLRDILESGDYRDKVVLFNGSNTDIKSREIYKGWCEKYKNTDRVTGSSSADMRAALVDYFRDEATIMIATEAAAEGINLQFCSLVINYDMPWNPQRIEQRIGRCHRYGQKYDVVVVNFLNKANAADVRVYELLRDKFKLFDGVFGASDEVLGSIENGVDFEKRIAKILQECRSSEEINAAFNTLQSDLSEKISDEMQHTRQQLLENFDVEVQEKLKINLQQSKDYRTKYETWLWDITQFYLAESADFSETEHAFTLKNNPFNDVSIHTGPYRIGKHTENENVYRIGHPIAQRIIDSCKNIDLLNSKLVFDYTHGGKKISVLENLVGQSGWLICKLLSVNAFELEEIVELCAITDNSIMIDKSICERFFNLSAHIIETHNQIPEHFEVQLNASIENQNNESLLKINGRNVNFFDVELQKLDNWGEDKRNSLRAKLKDLDNQIKDIQKLARSAANLPEKLKHEKERKQVENQRDEAWRDFDVAAKEINRSKDALIEGVEKRMQQKITSETLFCIKWKII